MPAKEILYSKSMTSRIFKTNRIKAFFKWILEVFRSVQVRISRIYKVNSQHLALSLSQLKTREGWSLRIWNGCTKHLSKMWHEIQSVAVTKSFKWSSFLLSLIKWLQISPEISIYTMTSGRWTLCHIALALLKQGCNPLKKCVKIQCTTIAGQKHKTWRYSKVVLVSLI